MVGVSLLVVASSCGRGSTGGEASRSSSSTSLRRPAVESITRHRGYAARLSVATTPIAIDDRFVLGDVGARPVTLRASLPKLASAPVHIESATHAGFTLDVTALDLAPSPGHAVGAAIVHDDVATSLDLVRTLTNRDVEELRVLRDDHAPTTHAWRLDVGDAIASARVHGRRVELFDDHGYAGLQANPIAALDASGRVVPVALSLTKLDARSYRLEATLDVRGAAYPVVLDPTWTSAPDGLASGMPYVVSAGAGKAVECVGGEASGATPAMEIFDLASNTWSSLAMPATHDAGTTIACFSSSDERVAFVDAHAGATSTISVLDAATETWSTLLNVTFTGGTGQLHAARQDADVALPGGAFGFAIAGQAAWSVSPSGFATNLGPVSTDTTQWPSDAFARSDRSLVIVNGPGANAGSTPVLELRASSGAATDLTLPWFFMASAQLGDAVFVAGGCDSATTEFASTASTCNGQTSIKRVSGATVS
ncbi:MAG: hypothetical protein ACHREM_27065, partial [Polyangiales bacterium]